MKVCPRTDTVSTEWVPMSDPHHRDICVNCGALEPDHVDDGRPTAKQLAERRKINAGVQDFLDEYPGDDPDSFMAKHFVVIPVTIGIPYADVIIIAGVPVHKCPICCRLIGERADENGELITNAYAVHYDAEHAKPDCDLTTGYHADPHTCGLREGGDGEKFGTFPELDR